MRLDVAHAASGRGLSGSSRSLDEGNRVDRGPTEEYIEGQYKKSSHGVSGTYISASCQLPAQALATARKRKFPCGVRELKRCLVDGRREWLETAEMGSVKIP